MSKLEVRDWIDIIDTEIKTQKKEQYLFMSMMGSSIIILAVLIWFTYINFIQNQDADYILGLLIIQNLSFYLIIFKRNINNTIYYATINRIKGKLPVKRTDVEFITNMKSIKIIAILISLFIFLILCELFVIENFLYYFITSSLIAFIIGMILWMQILFLNIMNPSVDIYQKLRYDIISGKITDVNVIRYKYLLIRGKPPDVIIVNEKGEYKGF